MHAIDFFDRGAERFAERAFLICRDDVRTYRQTQRRSHAIASALADAGFAPGTRAAILSPNCTEAIECLLGLLRAGACWVSLNARSPAAETIAVLNRSRADVLFVHPSIGDDVSELRRACPGLRLVVGLIPGLVDLPSLDDLVAGPFRRFTIRPPGSDGLYAIYATGGTTGEPKCVAQTNQTMETKVASLMIHLPAPKPPVNLLAAPFTHAAGTILQALMAQGTTNVVLPKFDAGEVLSAIERYRVTHLFLPPTAIYMLLDHPDLGRHDYSSLDYFIYAAAPMSVDKLERAIAVFGPVMTQTYGQVEAPNICACLSRSDHIEALASNPRRLASCGRATALTELEIMDEEGKLLSAEAIGEIVVRGNLVARGYVDQEGGIEPMPLDDGWHRTGDIGIKDRDGFVYLLDRKRDMIISGGFNIFPSEIERVLLSYPGIKNCTVFGIPHEKWGEAVHAVVEPMAGRKLDTTELVAFCRDRLGGMKAPKSVEICKALPLSPVGKVLKRSLRDRYWQGHRRAI